MSEPSEPSADASARPRGGAWRRALSRAASWPQPFELAAYVPAVAALLFLRWRGLEFGWDTVEFVLGQVAAAAPLLLLVGAALQLLVVRLRGESAREFLSAVARRAWLVGWLRIWLAGVAFTYTYLWLKISIPLVRGELFDVQLWQLERWLHFGLSPTVFAVELTAGTVVPAILDLWYALWIPSLPLFYAYVLASRREGLRRNFACANALLWTLGAWSYLAVPSLGPCYASPEIMAPVASDMPRAVATQRLLWVHYGKMLQSRGQVLEKFSPVYGVAAMPSLHVAAHWLFALWAKRYARRLYLPFAIATALTFLASLVTTWHYAIDGYAGMLLAWFAVAVADRWQPAGEPPEAVDEGPGAPTVTEAAPR